MRTVSATEAKNRFGTVLQEVTRTGGPLVIARAGRPVAVILSLATYEATCHHSALPRDRNQLARSAFGMWAARDDVDDDWLKDGRRNWHSRWHEEG